MKIAVVTSRVYAPWDERSTVLARLVGALACMGDVDVLAAGGQGRERRPEGAATRHTFPASPPEPRRRQAIELLTFGPARARADCGCLERARGELAREVTTELETELIGLQAGVSPELLEHLEREPYDLVVFAGAQDATTVEGMPIARQRCATMVLPLAIGEPTLGLPAVRRGLDAADAVLVTTASEARTVLHHSPSARVHIIGAVLRVHDLAFKNEPLLFEKEPAVVVAADWSATPPSADLLLSVRRLNRDFAGEVIVRLVGPGWEELADDVRAPHADSRFDVWRWVVRSLAVLEPTHNRILAREVLESLQYGTPVITSWSGAAREHADLGNGGLWYRSYDELRAAIDLLRSDEDLRKTLGDQGRTYARRSFGDTDAYISRVRGLVEAVLRRDEP